MSCKVTPFNLTLFKSSKETTNGQLMSGYEVGLNWPKGAYIHIFGSNFYLSKDGVNFTINNCYENGHVGHFFLARFLAFLETLLFYITLPFMLLTYVIFLVFALLSSFVLLFTLPCEFSICCSSFMGIQIGSNRDAFKIFMIIFLSSFLSILYSVVYCVTSPLSILVPELTCMLLKHHKWGTKPFSYF